MITKLRNWLKKQKRHGNLSSQSIHGEFRVKYEGGGRSQRFDYVTACNYAEIFNGKVINHDEQ